MKNNHISENIKYLRETTGLTQGDFGELFSVSRDNIASYERGSEPKVSFISAIVNYFHISYSDFIHSDLRAIPNRTKTTRNVIKENDNIIDTEFDTLPELQELLSIPLVDISVAAGSGAFNSDHLIAESFISLPTSMLKKGTYLCVKVKGPSMEPGLQDGGYIIIRHLDRGEWGSIKNEGVYVVTSADGVTWIKRVTNKLKTHGYIVCSSDHLDKMTYPPFNIREEDLHNIWKAEIYLSTSMVDIFNVYYEPMFALLAEDVAELKQQMQKVISKL